MNTLLENEEFDIDAIKSFLDTKNISYTTNKKAKEKFLDYLLSKYSQKIKTRALARRKLALKKN